MPLLIGILFLNQHSLTQLVAAPQHPFTHIKKTTVYTRVYQDAAKA